MLLRKIDIDMKKIFSKKKIEEYISKKFSF